MRTLCFVLLLGASLLMPVLSPARAEAVPPYEPFGKGLILDVGCAAVLDPTGFVDSNAVVIPRAVVQNFGTEPASFPVIMDIGGMYHSETEVQNLAAGAVDTVEFLDWRARERGAVVVSCQTQLVGDVNPFNDRKDTFVFVRVRDVRPLAIVSPTDTVDSNALVTPQVRVTNCGTDTASFWAYFMMFGSRDSARVENLAPAEGRLVTFASRRIDTSGTFLCCSWTAWVGDMNRLNDTISKPVFALPAGYLDAAAVRALEPAGILREGTLLTPRGVVKNNSGVTIDLNIQFQVITHGSLVYEDVAGTTLEPHQLDTISFSSWTASPADSYSAVLRVVMPGDMNPSNDSTGSDFVVVSELHDIDCRRIVAPLGNIANDPVRPQAWVRNLGSTAETFTVNFRIMWQSVVVYEDSQTVSGLGVDESTLVSFATWVPSPDTYLCRCSTALAGDMIESNNWQQARCVVELVVGEPGWHEIKPVPAGASGRQVKDGADLTILPGSPFVYLLKGNKSLEFFRYSIERDSWTTLHEIPLGTEEKKVGKGGALTNDGARFIYATKGNNSLGFYRYDIAGDSWAQLTDVPLGPSGKKVKGGTKMVYITRHDTGYCYLLKGYKNEFWRFNTITRTWDSLRSAPVGTQSRGEKYGDGSFIVYDQNSTIYAVKAKYNELYAYDVPGDSWHSRALAPFPLVGRSGRSKKVKSGAGGVFYHDSLFCLKGWNTQEFWAYSIVGNTWRELDTIPAYGSTHKKKNVKGGGAIALGGPGVFYVTKGNKTYEFWRYRIPPSGPGIEQDRPQATRPLPIPTVVRGVINLPAAFGASGRRFALIDATGRKVLELVPGANDVSRLSPGVYFFVRTEGVKHDASSVGKVVVAK
ncbi:MAG: hypothetical protein ABIK44_01525 [candidate division WOR-3 bacterium]